MFNIIRNTRIIFQQPKPELLIRMQSPGIYLNDQLATIFPTNFSTVQTKIKNFPVNLNIVFNKYIRYTKF